jgi:AbrB family looped-hinge helix DNA binding protein
MPVKKNPNQKKNKLNPTRLFGSVVVGTKGQFVIPAEARREFGIKSGDQLLIFGNTENNVIAVIKANQVSDLLQNITNITGK